MHIKPLRCRSGKKMMNYRVLFFNQNAILFKNKKGDKMSPQYIESITYIRH